MQKMIREWIEISGYNIDEEVVLYGIDLMSGDLLYSICIIMLGFLMKKEGTDSLLFLMISIAGTGTMGGVSL